MRCESGVLSEVGGNMAREGVTLVAQHELKQWGSAGQTPGCAQCPLFYIILPQRMRQTKLRTPLLREETAARTGTLSPPPHLTALLYLCSGPGHPVYHTVLESPSLGPPKLKTQGSLTGAVEALGSRAKPQTGCVPIPPVFGPQSAIVCVFIHRPALSNLRG